MLLFRVVFANTAPYNIINDAAGNLYDTVTVDLNIDYGRTVTQDSHVTLNLNITRQDVDLDNLKVQFSLDNENWSGYNPLTQNWENGFSGKYQPFYSGFYIGSDTGLKTVYAKIVDNTGNVGLASAKINFSSYIQEPYIANPQSLELSNFQDSLAKAGIKNGGGTLYDPYVISDCNTRLISKVLNVAEVCYYTDEGVWSPWYRVTGEQADIPIAFNNTEGLKEVRLRSKNKYGIESNTEIIYYLLDSSKPIISLHTDYHSFIAIDGGLKFDLEVYDDLSDIVDFVVEICSGRSKIVKEGKIKKYDDAKPTTTSIAAEGLPKGRFNVRVIVMDKAGNKNTKQVSVDSL